MPTHYYYSLCFCIIGFLKIHGAGFTDVTIQAGLNYVQLQLPTGDTEYYYDNVSMTGGAAAGDYDNDGWVDLFITRFDDSDILFRNMGDGTFTAVQTFNLPDVLNAQGEPQPAAIIDEIVNNFVYDYILVGTNGAAWGDIDNDGDLDLYVTTWGGGVDKRFYLYVNDGQGNFTEQAINRSLDFTRVMDMTIPELDAAAADLTFNEYLQARMDLFYGGLSPTFGDYDRDGWLDIHVPEWGSDAQEATVLLRNRGSIQPGYFDDTTDSAGVRLPEGSFGVAGVFAFCTHMSDFDGDGWPELAIAGDFGTSKLFHNMRDGTFTDVTTAAGVGLDENGMGASVGDYDGDGDLDWFVTSVEQEQDQELKGSEGNKLYRNEGGLVFTEVATEVGVYDGDWGWGTVFFDYDNDGDLDLAMTNGMSDLTGGNEFPLFENDPMRLWRNKGIDPDTGYVQFEEVSSPLGIDDTGSGKGILTFDYDNDGDLDLFVVNNGASPILYRNDINNQKPSLRIRLEGMASNRQGIGARLTLNFEDGTSLVRTVSGGNHYLGQSETIVHFGIGDYLESDIDSLHIEWPSGVVQTIDGATTTFPLTSTQHITASANLLNVTEPSITFKNWISKYSTSIDFAALAVEDNDNDGLSYLFEYFFRTSPLHINNNVINFSLANTPANTPHFRVDYPTPLQALDIEFRFETSANLENWTKSTPTSVTPFAENHLRASFPALNLEEPQFTRMRLILNNE